jgi:GNAT superfamily N-acetyltransferase
LNRRYEPPVRLGGDHLLEGFECRSVEQTSWLRRYARQSAAMETTRVFVVTQPGDLRVVAYHAWCMAHVTTEAATPRTRKGGGRYPQPVASLARLGVDAGHEGQGLGAALLQDVFARLLELSDRIGCRSLLVHAETPQARDFYRHLVPEFEPSPTNDLHLLLLMKEIRKALTSE